MLPSLTTLDSSDPNEQDWRAAERMALGTAFCWRYCGGGLAEHGADEDEEEKAADRGHLNTLPVMVLPPRLMMLPAPEILLMKALPRCC